MMMVIYIINVKRKKLVYNAPKFDELFWDFWCAIIGSAGL